MGAYRALCSGARIAGAILALAGMPAVSPALASASPVAPYGLPLPGTLRGTVEVPAGDRPGRPANTLDELYRALAACWEAPPGLRKLEGIEITARLSLRRDGSVIGPPKITFAAGAPEGAAKRVLVRATLEAIARCTPAKLTPSLGAAIAGRPVALRFVYRGPSGRDI